ncbi:hypothetical protein IMSAG049_00629 [Clostridiales bacterium]|nr:hypothetical protein IMSAG049_00629 [Clostridiales bacterium]
MPETPGRSLSQEEIEKLMGNTSSEPEDSPEPSPASSGGKMSQEEIERLMGGMNAQAPSAGAQPGTTPPNMGQQQGMYGMPPMGMYPPGFVPQDRKRITRKL